jgi:hypothetical protein
VWRGDSGSGYMEDIPTEVQTSQAWLMVKIVYLALIPGIFGIQTVRVLRGHNEDLLRKCSGAAKQRFCCRSMFVLP